MDPSWFPFSLLATVLFGVMSALYKLPAARNHSRFSATFWSIVSSALLAVFFFSSHLSETTPFMVWIALAWGGSYALLTSLQMYALRHVDTNTLFPITTTVSLILTVVSGVFLFGEYPTAVQVLGIALAITSIVFFLHRGGKFRYSSLLALAGLGIVVPSAFGKLLQKLAAEQVDVYAFQIYQYAFGAAFALLMFLIFERRETRARLFGGGLPTGSMIGVFSFFGGYSLYAALTRGPFPLITSIHSLYVLVTAVVAYFLFKEQLTARRVFLMLLAIVAVVLMRIG